MAGLYQVVNQPAESISDLYGFFPGFPDSSTQKLCIFLLRAPGLMMPAMESINMCVLIVRGRGMWESKQVFHETEN